MQTVAVTIYDRWGILAKQWAGLDGFWDGKINGTAAPEGIYVYLLDGLYLSGERVRKKSIITIYR